MMSAWQAWREAVRLGAGGELDRIYAEVERAVAEKGVGCDLSGRCCRFETWGHRLYVTGLEIAWVMETVGDEARMRLMEGAIEGIDGCVFQEGKICGAHGIRPLGCRVFFCDPRAEGWQEALYEEMLDAMKKLHEKLGVGYRYMEWRAGLNEARGVWNAQRWWEAV